MIPVIKPAASGEERKRTEPKSSSAVPNLPIGVLFKIFSVRAVGVPSGFQRSFSFCLVEKKPGAIALTLMLILAKWVANH